MLNRVISILFSFLLLSTCAVFYIPNVSNKTNLLIQMCEERNKETVESEIESEPYLLEFTEGLKGDLDLTQVQNYLILEQKDITPSIEVATPPPKLA